MRLSYPAVKVMLSLIVFFAAYSPLSAQKPNDYSNLETIQSSESSSIRVGNMRIDAESGYPIALYRVNYSVNAADPESMARQYLRENAQLLGLDPQLSDLVISGYRQTPAGHHIHFAQQIAGFPVYGSDITVTINLSNQVTFVMNSYVRNIDLKDLSINVLEAQAAQTARTHLNFFGRTDFEKTETVIFQTPLGTRLVQKVVIVPAENLPGDWEILVDAKTGTLLRVEDKAFYHGPAGLPAAVDTTNGSGWVFDPDPLTRSGATYNDPGFTDGNDTDTDSLTAQLVQVQLLDITLDAGTFLLTGPYAEIIDFEAPFDGIFSQSDSIFHYTRGQNAFEAVNVYFHIDKSMRYINETLGINLMPFQYPGGVQSDPHGFNGQDNSHYISSTGRLAWGEGGVDDAEDQDVVLHELGHGLHDWLTSGNISQVNGLSEGCGDYWTSSYVRSLGFWQPSDPQYNWVFQWDGHNPFWPGRVNNWPNQYPGGLTGSIHTDGQIWASTLMQIWNDIGREATDKNFLVGLAMTNGATNQEDAAQAFLQADIDQFGGAHLSQIEFWFTQRGYNVASPAPSIVHTPLSDTEDLLGPYTVVADISASASLDTVLLIFGNDSVFTDTVGMTSTESLFTAEINGTGIPMRHRYFIVATDDLGLTTTDPAGAPSSFHEFIAAPDTIDPVIAHSPIQSGLIGFLPVPIEAEVTDNLGIDSVWVEYNINGNPHSSFNLSSSGDDIFSGFFDFDSTIVSVGDSIQYRISARDNSSNSNLSVSPGTGYHEFEIEQDTGFVSIFLDDFESGDGNWLISNDGGTCVWEIVDINAQLYTLPTPASGDILTADSDLCGSGTTLLSTATLSDPVDLSSYSLVKVDFDSDWRIFDSADEALLDISVDGGNSWINLLHYDGVSVRDTHVQIDVSSIAGNQDSVVFRFVSIQPGWDWWWAIDNFSISVRPGTIVALDDPKNLNVPESFALHRNYPNPFNPTTTIRYDLRSDVNVSLKIYNVLGQEVRTLASGFQQAGSRSAVWDGKNDFGRQVASGIYVYRIEAGKFRQTRKMMLLK